MARQELKAPIDALFTEKNKFSQQLTQLKDRAVILQENMQKHRTEEQGFREARETLPKTGASSPARTVFDRGIADAHAKFEAVLKELEEVNKQFEVVNSKVKSLDKSIRELQSA